MKAALSTEAMVQGLESRVVWAIERGRTFRLREQLRSDRVRYGRAGPQKHVGAEACVLADLPKWKHGSKPFPASWQTAPAPPILLSDPRALGSVHLLWLFRT